MYKKEEMILTAEDQAILNEFFKDVDEEEERGRENEKLIKKAKRNRHLVVPPQEAYESLGTLEAWVRKHAGKYDTLILISKFWDKIGHFKKFIDMWIYIDELGVLEVWKVTKNSFYIFNPPKSVFSVKNQYREAANIFSSWRKRTRVPFELPDTAREMLDRRAKPTRRKIAFIVPGFDELATAWAQAEYILKFAEPGDIFIWPMETICKGLNDYNNKFTVSVNGVENCVDSRFDIYWLVKTMKENLNITVIVTKKGYINNMDFQERRISDFNIKSKTPNWTNEDYRKFWHQFY